MNRYFIGFLAVLGLGILILVLLLSGGHSKTPSKPTLYSYVKDNTTVQMVTDGPIVDPTSHNSVQISVSQNSASLTVFQGYEGDQLSTNSFTNTPNSFKDLLYALYYAGFTDGASSVPQFPSDIGLCATGDRYDFYLYVNGQVVDHYWQTSCSNDPRSFEGNFSGVQSLLQNQIPNYSSLVGNANI